jgi:signal recognition particle subunit SRP54|tara:strand:+ start:3332 stop:4708 length:1377 start_codon:yes stop_codon:yes gene_type:complete
MFENLTKKISSIFDKLKGKGIIDENSLNEALREIRVALLESDVSISIAKDFIERVKTKALGKEVIRSVSPAQMVVKIVNDELVHLLGSDNSEINLNAKPPAVIMMVGLQGSGKTTSTAKLAKWVEANKNKKVLMASLDIYRPAAQEQLDSLAKTNDLNVLEIQRNKTPLEISNIAFQEAKKNEFDVLILDSAGRNHIDKKMMNEIGEISQKLKFTEIFLVADAMSGQDAVNTAQNFADKIDLTGIILTRVDGDGRGGAALSMKEVTKKPIKFIGIGEKINDIEIFHPDRIVSRILGMGDVVSLVEKASEQIDKEDAEKLQKKILKGKFSLTDYAKQLDQISNMGGVQNLLKYLPGMTNIKEKVEESLENNDIFKKQKAIISSMTRKEKIFPEIVKASRKIRISKGSGTSVQDINKLLKQFKKMSQMMKKVGKNREIENMMKSGQMNDINSLLNKNKPF